MQCSRENALGADNQQERPVGNTNLRGSWKSTASSRAVTATNFLGFSPWGLLSVSLESSETVRQIPPASWVGKDTVRTAWRHAEGGRNVHSTSRESFPQRLKPFVGQILAARLKSCPSQFTKLKVSRM